MKETFLGITYPEFLQSDFIWNLWNKLFCLQGWHLFDECQSVEHHYLFCDACGFIINITSKRIK